MAKVSKDKLELASLTLEIAKLVDLSRERLTTCERRLRKTMDVCGNLATQNHKLFSRIQSLEDKNLNLEERVSKLSRGAWERISAWLNEPV